MLTRATVDSENRPLAIQGKTQERQLSRVLGFGDLVFLIIGTVVGSGIFLVPGAVLRPIGNSIPVAVTVWLTGGVLSLLGALTYGELSAMKPQAGGPNTILTQPVRAAVGVGIVLLGAPAYLIWRRHGTNTAGKI